MDKNNEILDRLEHSLFFTSEQKQYFKTIINDPKCLDFLNHFFSEYSPSEQAAHEAISIEMMEMNQKLTKESLKSETDEKGGTDAQSILTEAYM